MSLSDRGGGNVVKLKYLDDDDFVSIQSDEDVQTAFETWREQSGGGMGEVELWCK
jgi:cell division control protein 24